MDARTLAGLPAFHRPRCRDIRFGGSPWPRQKLYLGSNLQRRQGLNRTRTSKCAGSK